MGMGVGMNKSYLSWYTRPIVAFASAALLLAFAAVTIDPVLWVASAFMLLALLWIISMAKAGEREVRADEASNGRNTNIKPVTGKYKIVKVPHEIDCFGNVFYRDEAVPDDGQEDV